MYGVVIAHVWILHMGERQPAFFSLKSINEKTKTWYEFSYMYVGAAKNSM